jgi:signal transduction histidine kinase
MSSRHARLVLWPAAAAIGLAAERSLYGFGHGADWMPDLLTGWCLIGCGLVAWSRRPESRSGVLMTATGFAWFAPNFVTSSVVVLAWLSTHALYLHRGPLVQLLVTYPRGRATQRLERAAVALGYAAALVLAVWRSAVATIVLATLLVAVAVRRYVGVSGRERRWRLMALRATALLAAVLVGVAVIRLARSTATVNIATLRLYEATLCALAVGLLVGLLRPSWEERADVTDLVVELGEERSATLRGQLARALGDPSLQIGYFVPELDGFVDADGAVVPVPGPDSGLATTHIGDDGHPLALVIHDPTVLADAPLVEAVTSAARLGAANARLQAEVQARLAEIRASRRRILAARDEERNRLERDLHDGAERGLDELAATLHTARRSAARETTVERIAHSEDRLARAQADLRRLARGIHPRELSERGLAAALSALAEDFPLPVRLSISGVEASPATQACVYFVCAEALANVAKYASASNVEISVQAADGVTVEIADDGRGGADAAQGSGLRGLSDRVATLGGTLSVVSPPGEGTRLIAVIPAS